jgi:hypothetical protein
MIFLSDLLALTWSSPILQMWLNKIYKKGIIQYNRRHCEDLENYTIYNMLNEKVNEKMENATHLIKLVFDSESSNEHSIQFWGRTI